MARLTSVWLVNSLDASALIGLWDESPLDDPYVEQSPSKPSCFQSKSSWGISCLLPTKNWLSEGTVGSFAATRTRALARRPGLRTTSQSLASSLWAAARSSASVEVLAKRSG